MPKRHWYSRAMPPGWHSHVLKPYSADESLPRRTRRIVEDFMTIRDEYSKPNWTRRAILLVSAVAVGVVAMAGAPSIGLLGGGKPAGAAAVAPSGPPSMPPMPVDVDSARRRPIVDAVRAT